MNAANNNFKKVIGSDLLGRKLKFLAKSSPEMLAQNYVKELLDVKDLLKNSLGTEVSYRNNNLNAGFTITEETNGDFEIITYLHKNQDEWFEIVTSFKLAQDIIFVNVETDDPELFNLEQLKDKYFIAEFLVSNEKDVPSKFEIIVASLLASKIPEEVIMNNSLVEILKFLILFIRSEYDSDNVPNFDLKNYIISNIYDEVPLQKSVIVDTKNIVHSPYMELKW